MEHLLGQLQTDFLFYIKDRTKYALASLSNLVSG